MCYDATARPPLPPIRGGAVPISEELVLTAEDGTRFAAYRSQTALPAPGIVILPDVRGLHPFYQELAERVAPNDESDKNPPTLLASGYECPVLGLFGGVDQGITKAHVEGFRQALEEAGVRNDLVTYEGAPHSFFDRTYEQYSDACTDAWR